MRPGPVFELTSHLLQAVMADIGVGLVATFLVEEELRSGQLQIACDAEPVQGMGITSSRRRIRWIFRRSRRFATGS
jgi:DNA-binding transcriptional LysR family regulator